MSEEWTLTPELRDLLYRKFRGEQREFAVSEIDAVRSTKFISKLPTSRLDAYRRGFEDAYRSLGIHPDQEEAEPE